MTRSALAKAILRLHRKGEPLNISAVRRNHPHLLDAAFSYTPFLGWKQAIELAGLDYQSIRIELESHVECRICGAWRANLASHLRLVHGFQSGLEYRAEFPGASLSSEQFRSQFIGRNQNQTLPDWEPILSLEYVLDRAWYWYSHHGGCNVEFVRKRDPSIYSFTRSAGIAWDDVIRKIGLDPRQERHIPEDYPRVNRDDIAAFLKNRHDQGLSFHHLAILRADRGIYYSLKKEFGTVAAAVRELGISLPNLPLSLRSSVSYPDQESVIKALCARAAEGDSLAYQDIFESNRPLILAINRHFHGLGESLVSAGLRERNPKSHLPVRQKTAAPARSRTRANRYPDADAVVEAIRDRHRRGLSLSQSDLIGENDSLTSAAYSHCGRWINAIRMAGLESEHQQARDARVNKNAVYQSRDAVVQALRQRASAHKGISSHSVAGEDRPLRSAVYRYFGSWPVAIEAAGLAALLAEQKRGLIRRARYPKH